MNRWWIISLLVALMPSYALAQEWSGVQPDTEDGDSLVRVNPEFGEWGSPPPAPGDYSAYPFLNLKSNRIELNGDDWTSLRGRFAAVDDTVVSIVHIGDSHLQAEGATSRTRALLQKFYGSSGRGLVTPLRLAGTNQPTDYKITSSAEFRKSVLMKRPWEAGMGFTGIAISPISSNFDFTISTIENDGVHQDFDCIHMYGHGAVPRLNKVESAECPHLHFDAEEWCDTLVIWLSASVNEVTLDFIGQGHYDVYGFRLENSMTGVEYHVIGNNGARYDSYTDIGTVGSDIQSLSPDLIIISLGANEAFGRISNEAFYANIGSLVSDVRKHNPEAKLLLVTPAECQRKVKYKRRRTFQKNVNILRLRNEILRYGREHNIPTYDWYAVAGGDGSSAKWVAKGLFGKDRIHNSWTGYQLQGNLFYDALIDAVDNK